MGGADERDRLLCVLALADSRALSGAELEAWIDAEVTRIDAAPSWLIDASLATSPEDRLHHLRGAAGVGPGHREPLLYLAGAIYAHGLQRLSDEDLARLALHASWDHDLPGDVVAAVYELDEAALCAHAFEGAPQPELVRQAVSSLSVAVGRAAASMMPLMHQILGTGVLPA